MAWLGRKQNPHLRGGMNEYVLEINGARDWGELEKGASCLGKPVCLGLLPLFSTTPASSGEAPHPFALAGGTEHLGQQSMVCARKRQYPHHTGLFLPCSCWGRGIVWGISFKKRRNDPHLPHGPMGTAHFVGSISHAMGKYAGLYVVLLWVLLN